MVGHFQRGGARVIAAVLVVVLVVIVGLWFSRPAAVTKAPQERTWHVNGVKVNVETQSPAVFLLGKVESAAIATLTSAMEADVLSLHVNDGSTVEAGTPLLELDDREAQERLRQREAELQDVNAQLTTETARYKNDLAALEQEQTLLKLTAASAERLRKLETRELTSRNQLDEALQSNARQELSLLARKLSIDDHPSRLKQLQARQAQAQSKLNLAQIELGRTKLVAPYAAAVVEVNVAAAQRVRVGDKLLTIYPLDGLEVRAQVPARHIAQIREALSADIEVAGFARIDGSDVPVVLDRLAAQVVAGSAGVDAYFTLPKTTLPIPLNRVVELMVSLAPVNDVFAVPREALYGTDQIFKIVSDRLVTTKARVVGATGGWGDGGMLLIDREGFSDGETVLATKFANAMEGISVAVNGATDR